MIINQITKGSGVTPTGTIQITTNGITDVTNYANADVQVPTTAPARYIKLKVGDTGQLTQDGGSVPDLTGVTSLGSYVFANAFRDTSTLPASTTLDFSNINTFGSYCLYYAFWRNTNLTGKITIGGVFNDSCCRSAFAETGITEVEITDISFNSGNTNMLQSTFSNCSSLTKVTISATTIGSGNANLQYTFDTSAISTLDVSAVTTIAGGTNASTAGHDHMFGNLANLSSVTWTSLTGIARNAFNQMFYGSAITSMSFPAVTTSSFQHNQALASMLSGVANCTLHFPSNVQATVEALSGYSTTAPFGATAGTVLFDLPATE